MLEIRPKALREYFKVSEALRFGAHDIPWRVKYRHWLHPLLFSVVCAVLFLILSLTQSLYFFISLSIVGFLILTYKQTKRSAQWIEITRTIPKTVFHRDRLKVVLNIKNKSHFHINDLLIKDCFSVSSLGEKEIWLGYEIKPREKLRIEYEINADSGMGKQQFGPLQAIISDPLGLFEVRRIDHENQDIEVLPAPTAKLAHLAPKTLFSDSLGIQESPRPGDSVSFFELRNYVPGDALKKISWKLSSKFQKLLVKEFEDLISEDFTVYLDLGQNRHFGLGSSDTWEATKEASISIILNGDQSRRYQILSQNLEIPFGNGSHQSVLAADRIRHLLPTPGENHHQRMQRLQDLVPFGSSLLYIGPTYLEDSRELIDSFRLLRHQGVETTVVIIDSASFMNNPANPAYESYLVGWQRKAEQSLREMIQLMSAAEIPYTVLRREDFLS